MVRGRLHVVLERVRELAGGRSYGDGTDNELLERFTQHQEEAAFTALVARHGRMVFRLCRRILAHQQDAEDAFQATFLVLARNARSIRQRESVASWLYGVAFRVALQAKKTAARLPIAGTDPEPVAPDATTASPLDRELLDQELNRLPAKYRAPVVLCWLEERTNEEAAAALGWPKGTVQGRLARARTLLRDRLARRGVVLPAVLGAAWAGPASAMPPPALTETTIQAGLVSATKSTTLGTTSATVAALTEGVIRAMNRQKTTQLLTMFVAILGLTAGVAGLIGLGGAWAVPTPELPTPVKSDPPGAGLEMTLVARNFTPTLAEVKKIEESRQRTTKVGRKDMPKVNLELVFKNVSNRELQFWLHGVDANATNTNIKLQGPGAEQAPGPGPKPGGLAFPPDTITLAPGKTTTLALDWLESPGPETNSSSTSYFWTKPGDYTLTVEFRTAVSPAPKDAREATFRAWGPVNLIDPTVPKGFGIVTLTSNPLAFKVADTDAPAPPK